MSSGGKFRKDTWGYNLLHLIIGSEGTLGIVTKVVVNLVSSAGKTVDLLVPFGAVETAVNAGSRRNCHRWSASGSRGIYG